MNPKEESFFEKVYEVVRRIPEGRTTSYAAIAESIALKISARRAGWAMNAAHSRSDVPAHRVVNRNGLLTGRHHFSPPELMQQLLENEGVKIENNQILNFEEVFWKPD